MAIHKLKSWTGFFEPVFTGEKTFELRINDRKFKVGDILHLREYDDHTRRYTGRSIRKQITYILDGVGQGAIAPLAGLHSKYCIMSLAKDLPKRAALAANRKNR